MKSRGPESLRGLAPGPTGPGVCPDYALLALLEARLDALGRGPLRICSCSRRLVDIAATEAAVEEAKRVSATLESWSLSTLEK